MKVTIHLFLTNFEKNPQYFSAKVMNSLAMMGHAWIWK